nr:MAG TPA: hypothetical protein [Caudoviricetes sp.]
MNVIQKTVKERLTLGLNISVIYSLVNSTDIFKSFSMYILDIQSRS